MFFFFFKQKTAYELRISDWSSDVCSSDLAQRPGELRQAEALARPRRPALQQVLLAGARLRLHLGFVALPVDRDARRHRPALLELGRASCRERVCRYV